MSIFDKKELRYIVEDLGLGEELDSWREEGNNYYLRDCYVVMEVEEEHLEGLKDWVKSCEDDGCDMGLERSIIDKAYEVIGKKIKISYEWHENSGNTLDSFECCFVEEKEETVKTYV